MVQGTLGFRRIVSESKNLNRKSVPDAVVRAFYLETVPGHKSREKRMN